MLWYQPIWEQDKWEVAQVNYVCDSGRRNIPIFCLSKCTKATLGHTVLQVKVVQSIISIIYLKYKEWQD